jgi:regulator of protease activity HflC (stomatin/prohibitin superfamily)
MKSLIAAGVIAFFTLLVGFLSFYTVAEGYRGVNLRNGAVVGQSEPGLGFQIPFIDSVREISIQQQTRVYENVLAYSFDQQTASFNISVNYSLPADMILEIYSEYGSEEAVVSRVLDRQIRKTAEEIFGKFTAVKAVQDRQALGAAIQSAIQASVIGPITIHSVQLENIDFSDAYENSIEARMLAEVEVQKVRQNAERAKVEAEISVIQAQAAADARLAQATVEAEAIRLKGEAEAEAIKARSAALADNPAIIALTQAERWDGKLPVTMIPNSTVPFLDMGTTLAAQ